MLLFSACCYSRGEIYSNRDEKWDLCRFEIGILYSPRYAALDNKLLPSKDCAKETRDARDFPAQCPNVAFSRPTRLELMGFTSWNHNQATTSRPSRRGCVSTIWKKGHSVVPVTYYVTDDMRRLHAGTPSRVSHEIPAMRDPNLTGFANYCDRKGCEMLKWVNARAPPFKKKPECARGWSGNEGYKIRVACGRSRQRLALSDGSIMQTTRVTSGRTEYVQGNRCWA
jgi:hypothetical protein